MLKVKSSSGILLYESDSDHIIEDNVDWVRLNTGREIYDVEWVESFDRDEIITVIAESIHWENPT